MALFTDTHLGLEKMMTMSKDVGLVVVGADLVGLVDRHTPGFGKDIELFLNNKVFVVGKNLKSSPILFQ